MQPAQSSGPDYSARIRRTQYLAARYPFAAEVLTFYEKLAALQSKVYGQILRNECGPRSQRAAPAWSAPNVDFLLAMLPDLLATLKSAGPNPVRDAARRLSTLTTDQRKAKLLDFWVSSASSEARAERRPADSREPLTEFILRLLVQPYAEFIAAEMPDPPLTVSHKTCPRCGAAPLLGVLRPEGDGGKRRLLCSFCLREWDSRRILCAACGEEDEKKLPVYVEAEQFPHIRVEACDTCKFYVRTIDLTKDGNAAPIVDDLAAIPLSLWAHEHGYQRIHQNLLGT
jgi:formate dehydrogenase accessory protein FdhE